MPPGPAIPEIDESEPLFRFKAEGRHREPSRREPFDNTQFPVAAYDAFAKSFVPRWVTNDAATTRAYDALVKRVCPCVLMVHSQGSNFDYNAALDNPGLIKVLVLIEPSGAPDPAKADAAAVKDIPHLVVYGDYLDRSPF